MRLGAWRWTDPQYTYLAPHNTPCPPAGSTVPTPPPFTHPSLPQHATGMHIHTKNQSCTTIYLYGLDVRIGVRHSRLEQLVLTHTPSLHRRCQKRSTILTMWWNGVAGAWEFNFLWIWKTGIACAGGGGVVGASIQMRSHKSMHTALMRSATHWIWQMFDRTNTPGMRNKGKYE